MCGIVGIVSTRLVKQELISSLKKLEYRGYDSSGIAFLNKDHSLCTIKSIGKVKNLEHKLSNYDINSHIGIAHTRWATHGIANEINAHPHCSDDVAIVHNGIIENYQDIKAFLITNSNPIFKTETDTEVLVHLIQYYLSLGQTPQEATSSSIKKLKGSFAFIAIFPKHPELMIISKKSSPLIIGYGEYAMYVGSDVNALSIFTQKISYLNDYDIAVITHDHVEIYNEGTIVKNKIIYDLPSADHDISTEEFDSFMIKEIHEQPKSIQNILDYYTLNQFSHLNFSHFKIDVTKIEEVIIIACGSSFYAGKIAQYWFENYALTSTKVEISSEFRYKNMNMDYSKSLFIFISQSGETADTLQCLRNIKATTNAQTIAILNSHMSSMKKEVDIAFNIIAGLEIGVAATKTFTNQVLFLKLLSLYFAEKKETISNEKVTQVLSQVQKLPSKFYKTLISLASSIQKTAHDIQNTQSILYIGRGLSYNIALEGALKMKELSYIHAEAIASGELKHGSIALVDNNIKIIALMPSDNLFDKNLSNTQTILAREGQVIVITDPKGAQKLEGIINNLIVIDSNWQDDQGDCLLYGLVLQLLAYYVAKHKGYNIDQPRNLAKSVTVE